MRYIRLWFYSKFITYQSQNTCRCIFYIRYIRSRCIIVSKAVWHSVNNYRAGLPCRNRNRAFDYITWTLSRWSWSRCRSCQNRDTIIICIWNRYRATQAWNSITKNCCATSGIWAVFYFTCIKELKPSKLRILPNLIYLGYYFVSLLLQRCKRNRTVCFIGSLHCNTTQTFKKCLNIFQSTFCRW